MKPQGEEHTLDSNEILKKEHDLLIQEMNSGYCLNETIFDKEGKPVNFKILKINKAFRTHSGILEEVIEGKTILDLYPSLDNSVISKLGNLKESDKLIEFETFDKDSGHYYFLKAYTVEKDLFACIFKNITKEKFTEIEFKKSQIFTQKVLNTAPNLIYIYDLEQKRNIYASQGLDSILGYTTEEFIEMGEEVFDKLLHPDDRNKLRVHLDKFNDANDGDIFEIEYRYKHKNGDYRTLKSYESIFLRDSFNKVKQFIGTAVDITKRKQAEEKITVSEKRFRTMIELNSIPMVITDLNQDLVMLNKEFTKIYGYTIEDIPTAKKWWNTAYPDLEYRKKVQDEWDSSANKAMQENSNIPKQIWSIICKDGSKKTVEFSFVNLGDLNILSMNDITELKEKEEELKAAKEKAEESDLLKSAFLANMSHEIRTPMNGLVGFVDLLLQDDLSEEKKKFYRNIIQDSCQRLLNIINDILDISKIETKQFSVHLEEINLNDFMLETYSLFLNQAKNKNIPLNLKKGLDDHNSFIITDSQKLKQILNNLLSNAIKFTHSGEIVLEYKLNGQLLEFYVQDTGIGISSEYIQYVFERFIQADTTHERKYGGTGLGLSIAKGFTEILGGTISCHSILNEGSTFKFTLPYKPGDKNTDETILEELTKSKDNSIRILVAEDEEINYLYLEEVLHELGNIKPIHVLNGEDAVNTVKKDKSISLVLMDIKMPVMNGLEATKIIKKIRPDLPVIAQTAYAMAEDEQLARDAGCDSYISKPVDREKFMHIIRSFI